MTRRVVGQVAVVTGASSGLGWALGRHLASVGFRVGLIARRVERLHELEGQIVGAGGQAVAAAADVTCAEQTAEAVARIRAGLGPIDWMIANAGVGMPTPAEPVNVADIGQMFQVNVLGVVHAFAAVLPEMLHRQNGHLAAVSSLAAYKGLPGESAYCASKAAVNTYLEGLRIHLRDRGIRVTLLCPGFVRTPMTAGNTFPMPGLLDADDAARRMIKALYRGRRVYNFPWRTTLLVGLARWLPDGLLARLLHNYNEAAVARSASTL
jgi:short-subunit dehydrogenase